MSSTEGRARASMGRVDAEGALVAVRLPAWLGDAVMAEPVLRAVASKARVRWIGPAKLVELFASRAPGSERVALSSREREHARDYSGADVALLLNGSWSSAWSAYVARVPVRAGFAGRGRRPWLTDPLGPALERGGVACGLGRKGDWPRALPRPFSAACVELAALAGVTVASRAPRIAPNAEVLARVRAIASERARGRPFALVHAGARPGSAKGVPADRWVAVLERMGAELVPVLCCAPGEETSARAVRDALRRESVLLDDPAPDVEELVAWTSLATLVVTPDNGARHVAQACGKPAVVLCGPTDPRHTQEHAPTTRVVRVEVACGPCHCERCPLSGDAHHACMRSIEPARVAAEARELVESAS